ncbi:MAG: hypothetical protein JSR93_03305 [Verrucomicrobia bacterium]|nr:hypothetical protein [Verrucomicrobiota bacterium]
MLILTILSEKIGNSRICWAYQLMNSAFQLTEEEEVRQMIEKCKQVVRKLLPLLLLAQEKEGEVAGFKQKKQMVHKLLSLLLLLLAQEKEGEV